MGNVKSHHGVYSKVIIIVNKNNDMAFPFYEGYR